MKTKNGQALYDGAMKVYSGATTHTEEEARRLLLAFCDDVEDLIRLADKVCDYLDRNDEEEIIDL
jgi:hypothetical protein